MSGAPATGDNKHWILSHLGPLASNRFSIGYKISSATGFAPYDPSEYLIITTAGNVGIGTTAPDSTLHVIGGIAFGDFVGHGHLFGLAMAQPSDLQILTEFSGSVFYHRTATSASGRRRRRISLSYQLIPPASRTAARGPILPTSA